MAANSMLAPLPKEDSRHLDAISNEYPRMAANSMLAPLPKEYSRHLDAMSNEYPCEVPGKADYFFIWRDGYEKFLVLNITE